MKRLVGRPLVEVGGGTCPGEEMIKAEAREME